MDKLQRFIDLVNKTGDKLVIFDRYQPDNSFVILAINDYEQLVEKRESSRGLTEDELADKINRDIAVWKNEHILDDVSESEDWDDIDWSAVEDDKDDWPIGETVDDDTDEAETEELNYLYPEPELATMIDKTVDLAGDEAKDEITAEAIISEPEINHVVQKSPMIEKEEFQSLRDILGAKFEKNNHQDIVAESSGQTKDETQSRYETIGF